MLYVKRKTALMVVPIFLVLISVSLFISPVAANGVYNKAFVLGMVNAINTPDGPANAWGLILASATEPDTAKVTLFFFVPAYRELWCIQLVATDEVEIVEAEEIIIVGYFNFYINCQLVIEGELGAIFTTGSGWNNWEMVFAEAPVELAGSFIYHSFQAG